MIEFNMAVKYIADLYQKGRGYYVCIQNAMKLLMLEGFSEEYSQSVAERAFDFVSQNS
jgi:predicted RNA-binding protein YlxR (DUF448 family)